MDDLINIMARSAQNNVTHVPDTGGGIRNGVHFELGCGGSQACKLTSPPVSNLYQSHILTSCPLLTHKSPNRRFYELNCNQLRYLCTVQLLSTSLSKECEHGLEVTWFEVRGRLRERVE